MDFSIDYVLENRRWLRTMTHNGKALPKADALKVVLLAKKRGLSKGSEITDDLVKEALREPTVRNTQTNLFST